MKILFVGGVLAISAITALAQSTVTTSGGTAGTVPLFNGTSTLGNSVITQSGGLVGINGPLGIGTTTPSYPLTVNSSSQEGAFVGVSAGSTNVTSNAATGLFIQNHNATPGDFARIAFYDANSNTQGSMGVMYGNHTGMDQGTFYIEPRVVGTPSSFVVAPSGYVGIGTTSPAYNLDVTGVARAQAGIIFPDGNKQTTAWTGVLCGGDYAEAVEGAGDKKQYEPGDVLVLTSGNDDEVQKSSEPYSTMVAGIFATKPGVVGRREALAKNADNLPMAMVGIVPTKVTAENGPIRKGDLLVSSSLGGYAMKGTDRSRMLGAVIGKAMGSLDSGTGVIAVLVTLQ